MYKKIMKQIIKKMLKHHALMLEEVQTIFQKMFAVKYAFSTWWNAHAIFTYMKKIFAAT